MKIIEALELEIKTMETKNKEFPAYRRDDVTQVMIGFRFKDGHTHWLLPDRNTTEKMAVVLSVISMESTRWETIEVAKEILEAPCPTGALWTSLKRKFGRKEK